MADADREQVFSLLRACLMSMKGGVPLRNLNRDYRMLAGSEIPYQKLGYQTLEKFLETVPDVSLSLGQGGEVILNAIPTKNTAHLAEMVSKQKSASKRTKHSSRNVPPRRSAASLRRPPPSSLSGRASKRLPTDDTHGLLSITVNNRSENVDCTHEPARQVSFAASSSKPGAPASEPTSSGSTGGEFPYLKYEKPPRFLKSSQPASSAPSVPAVAPAPASKPAPTHVRAAAAVPASLPAHTPVPATPVAFPVASSVCSKAQKRLQHIKSTTKQTAKKDNLKLSLSGTDVGSSRAANNGRDVSSTGDDAMPSPLTPLHARLLAAVQKSVKVPAASPWEEEFVAASFGDSENFTEKLDNFAVSKGMKKPQYSVVPQIAAGKLSYSCFVMLDDFSTSSYPELRSSPGEAMNVAAKQALEEIENRRKMTQGGNMIMSRVAHVVGEGFLGMGWQRAALGSIANPYPGIPHQLPGISTEIVAGRRSGVWSTQIVIDYNKLYNESLPDDWLDIMAHCPLVSLNHVAANKIIVTPSLPTTPTESINTVIDAPKIPMETPREQVPGTPVQSVVPGTPVQSVVPGTPVQSVVPVSPVQPFVPVSPVQPFVPERIQLPQDDVWDIYITCGSSTKEIWGRLIGEDYSVQYENLATDMEMFYMEHVNVVPNPEVGSFYAIKIDDCWHRVELVEINETHTKGWVFFIDHGDEEEVLLKELHLLEQRFARLPAQAVRCFLWGLENFADDPNVESHITDIVGKALIASVKSLPNANNPGVGIVLYDTSTEEDLNLNTMLLESISKNAVAPQLPAEGKVAEVYISHVTVDGDVYLQFESYSYVHSLVSSVVESSLKEGNSVRDSKSSYCDPSRLYLAQYHSDGNWYRAAVRRKLDGQEKAVVIFVDFGNTETVNLSEMVLLDTLKKSVAEFPYQAIKVRLHNVPYSSFSERLRELVPCDERVLVKTISARPLSNIPVVEIFKRIQPDNLLVSVNSTLAFEPDLKPLSKPPAGDGPSLRSRKRLERLQRQGLAALNNCQSDAVRTGNSTLTPECRSPVNFDSHDNEAATKSLGPPQIPAVGDYFDVHVTMAANPGNFTVQPYKDVQRLEKMMETMQAEYNQQKYPHPPLDSVKEGELYAALHRDGRWYRVCVSNVMNDNIVSIYFCDYGDVSVLPLDKLQPLIEQFKELPYQAIKAKLAGIQPKHSDWCVEDCLVFQKRVVEHDFVSIIMEKGPDLLNPASMILGLRLIDTSGKEDIYIDELLVSQDIAVVRTSS